MSSEAYGTYTLPPTMLEKIRMRIEATRQRALAKAHEEARQRALHAVARERRLRAVADGQRRDQTASEESVRVALSAELGMVRRRLLRQLPVGAARSALLSGLDALQASLAGTGDVGEIARELDVLQFEVSQALDRDGPSAQWTAIIAQVEVACARATQPAHREEAQVLLADIARAQSSSGSSRTPAPELTQRASRLVAAVEDSQAQAAEREAVLDIIGQVLGEMGYRAVRTASGEARDGQTRFASPENGQVEASLGDRRTVLFHYGAADGSAAPRAAVEGWCQDYGVLRSRLAARGIQLPPAELEPDAVQEDVVARRRVRARRRQDGSEREL